MKKKIAINEVMFLCNKDDLALQKKCPFYENIPHLDTDIKGLCVHNNGYDDSECCWGPAMMAFIKDFKI